MKYQAILFDMDGTVLDSRDDLTDAINHTLRENGFPAVTRDEVVSATGHGASHLLASCLPKGEDTPHFPEILQQYKAYYAAHTQVNTKPYEGIPGILNDLQKRGVKVAIVSNKPMKAACTLGEHFFPGVLTVGEDPARPRKPAPDMVWYALSLLGVDKDHACYVGDSEVDVATARAAGVELAAVDWGFRSREMLMEAGAECIASNAAELRKLLGL